MLEIEGKLGFCCLTPTHREDLPHHGPRPVRADLQRRGVGRGPDAGLTSSRGRRYGGSAHRPVRWARMPGTSCWPSPATRSSERQLLERLLDLWRREHGRRGRRPLPGHGGRWSGRPPWATDCPGARRRCHRRRWAPAVSRRLLLFRSRPRVSRRTKPAGGERSPDPAAAAALKSCRLKQDLKEQQFQVNYRVVELEALYDVGLAVASTLDLDRLPRRSCCAPFAARRPAGRPLHPGGRPLPSGRHLRRRCGGSGCGRDPRAASLPGRRPGAPDRLLPGARYLLAVPIEVESGRRGLLVPWRQGEPPRRRTVPPLRPPHLSLFANQAALALENARLHRQALEKERLEREMHLAAEIQRQILPRRRPRVPGYELVGWYRPARQVGGDYYDLFSGRGRPHRPGAGGRFGQGDAGGPHGLDAPLGPAPADGPRGVRAGAARTAEPSHRGVLGGQQVHHHAAGRARSPHRRAPLHERRAQPGHPAAPRRLGGPARAPPACPWASCRRRGSSPAP